ncbi:MAG: dimethylarginine dimethylaminohydrolase [Alphaproteobacteria bacterium]|nr:dimethylarginine dimethylaminohydrolase [Alphaproteobacteria bacterium]
MTGFFHFSHAITRAPGTSVIHGLRTDLGVAPDYEGIAAEHGAYVAALRDLGLTVDVLPPLEDYPDSIFVEDPALVFSEGAILLRPGAPSRLGERDDMRRALARHFEHIAELAEGENADGGDVLVTPSMVFIGLSQRTNTAGATALCRHLSALGRAARVVATPAGVLHLKTACALLAVDTVLVTPAMAASGVFSGFRLLLTPDGEEGAANALRLHDTVLVSDAYPCTIELLNQEGFRVRPLCVRQIAKLDAGLSCLSLRW